MDLRGGKAATVDAPLLRQSPIRAHRRPLAPATTASAAGEEKGGREREWERSYGVERRERKKGVVQRKRRRRKNGAEKCVGPSALHVARM